MATIRTPMARRVKASVLNSLAMMNRTHSRLLENQAGRMNKETTNGGHRVDIKHARTESPGICRFVEGHGKSFGGLVLCQDKRILVNRTS